MMLYKIPIGEIPFINCQKDEEKSMLFRIAVSDINPKDNLLHNILASNYYLQVIASIHYFSQIPEFPSVISIPNDIHVDKLPYIEFIQTLSLIFKHMHAIINNDSIVLKIQVKGLSQEAIKVIKELDNTNNLDPIIKNLFSYKQPYVNDNSAICAFAVNKEKECNNKVSFSNLQKYLLWECIKNDNFYGLPISQLLIDNFKSEEFNELIQIFENTYLVGKGEPWLSTHLIFSKVNHNLDSNYLEKELSIW